MSGYNFVMELKSEYGLLKGYRMAKEYLEMQKDAADKEERQFCAEIKRAIWDLDRI